jgi:hypothetical protein
MKLSYFVKILTFLALLHTYATASLQSKSAVVYYGAHLSYPMVGIHDYIIIDPDQIKVHTTGFKTYKENIYAYVSINELHKSRSYAKSINPAWVIGKNDAWQSNILDIANPDYQDFLLEEVLAKLKKRGFKNFFFDTMDSYQLAPVSTKEKIRLKEGVVTFIKRFKKYYPDAKLVVNRGFEIIDEIYPYIDALLFESYYYGIDAKTMTYKKVTPQDRVWLDTQLSKVQAHQIPIIALDYLPHTHKKEIAQDIIELEKRGFIPYIAQKELMDYGSSSKKAFPREVLLVYNGAHLEDDYIGLSNAHLFAAMPLEYLGFVPRLVDVNKPLPYSDLSNQYAGIIIWLDRQIPDYLALMNWVKYAISQNVKVLFLGDASFSLQDKVIQTLGIQYHKSHASKKEPLRKVHQDKLFGFEIPPSVGYQKELLTIQHGSPLMTYQNAQAQTTTLAALMPWGGYAKDEALMSSYGEFSLWVCNPFSLFTQALRLPKMPAPDPTTENGKRLMFLHVDGDGSMNRVESNPKEFSIQRVLNHFIKKYTFPQSISIVESETAKHGKYPKLSATLEKAAQKIYQYPYIEGATHTFSHPYHWRELERDPSNPHYRTPLKYPYTFTPKREFDDSLAYINQKLIQHKRKKAKTVFWSGDCSPSETILAYTYQHNLLNINGGDTYITNDRPWLSLVQPLGLQLGDYYQVFTGQQNENVYTNDWLGPFWAFKKVIQTFNLTESPRRLKPIDVYYHFYSASKTASEQALKEIYDWVLTQDVMHIFTSEYPQKVTNFYDASLSQENNQWLLCGFDKLRTVRLPTSLGVPHIQNSLGVAGYNNHNNNYYVHLDNKKNKILTLLDSSTQDTHLISANARLLSQEGNTQHFKGHMPITLSYTLKPGCSLHTRPKARQIKKDGQIIIKFKTAKDVYVTQKCR